MDILQMENKRLAWPDIAKGIGIILVVLGHLFDAYDRRQNTINLSHTLIYKTIYSFHMPLFFFLSGIFVASWLSRPFLVALWQKFRRLMIQYFLWGVILVAVFGVYEHTFDVLRILELPFRPIFVLWFVYSLFIDFILLYFFINSVSNKTLNLLHLHYWL